MGQIYDPTVYKNQPTITEILPVGDSLSERLDKGTNIEAATYSFETKRQDHFRSKIESEKTFATSPADTEQTSNKGKITNRKTSFFMGPQRNYLLYGAFNSS
ncbi:MAG: hypothetical protein ACWGNI_11065 [Desulfobacterales bacterium]